MGLNKESTSSKSKLTKEMIGLVASIFGILAFFGISNMSAVVDMFQGSTIVETPVIDEGEPEPAPLQYPKADTTDSQHDPTQAEDQKPDERANGYYVEIATDTSNTVSLPNTENVNSLTERQPSKGYGKVVFRNICSYCHWIKILMPESAGGEQEISLRRFDPNEKWETSKSSEYLPGTYYNVPIEYGHNDTVYRDVVVKEGKTIVYYFNKHNPFRKGCGRLAFISLQSSRKYNVSVTEYNNQPIKGYGQTRGITKNKTSLPIDSNGQVVLNELEKSVLYFDLPSDHYRYTVSDPHGKADDPNLSKISNTIRLYEGYLEVVYLD